MFPSPLVILLAFATPDFPLNGTAGGTVAAIAGGIAVLTTLTRFRSRRVRSRHLPAGTPLSE